jgi:hypothetical protein
LLHLFFSGVDERITLSFGYNVKYVIEDMIKRDDAWKNDEDPRKNYLQVVSKVFLDRGQFEEYNYVLRGANVDVWDIRKGGWRSLSPRNFCELVISRVNEVLSPDNCDEGHEDGMTEYVRCLENDDALVGSLVPMIASLFGLVK